MICDPSPSHAAARLVFLTSLAISILTVTSRATAQSGASLAAPVEPAAYETSEAVPAPPEGRPRDGRAWASVTFVGVTHQTGGPLLPSTVGFVGLYDGPFALGMVFAVAEGVLLGGQLEGSIAIDEDGLAGGNGRIGPRIELLFGDPPTPLFVAAEAWLGFSVSRDSFGAVSTFGQAGASASFGVHVFVSRELSISPSYSSSTRVGSTSRSTSSRPRSVRCWPVGGDPGARRGRGDLGCA